MPDIIANGGDDIFASLAKSGVLADLTGAPQLANVQDAYVKMLKDIPGTDKVYAIPYGVNADGVIYNKKLFKELNLTVPTTWDEFIALGKKIQAAGKTPIYFTFKDPWTTLPYFNAIAANLQAEDFFKKRKANQATFAEGYKEVAQKYQEVLQFGQQDKFGKGYNDGNVAYANGESVLYMQGVWAIPEIKKANPNIELGVFPFPATNNAGGNKIISGVDQLLSLSATTKHPEEAKKFIDFLLKPESVKTYIKEVYTFSALKGIPQEDPALADLKPVFDKGLIVDFVDHYIPSSMKLDQLLQDLVMNKNTDSFLKKLDDEWAKSQTR